ncbi:MAG: ATP-binding protein [Williamsia sp.]|nr:ATP-binding protein [Williamsia sp.]
MKRQTQNYDIIRPEPESLLQAARSFGYSLETAIADLIDNSITARATIIKITYGIDIYSSFVKIEDNGDGMNEAQLMNAMKMGSYNPLNQRCETDLGRFGLGLKTASFSQCRRLTVKTRNQSDKEFIRCWDLDIVAAKKEWVLLRKCADKKSERNLGEILGKDSSTVVLWEKLDRLIESNELQSNREHFYRKFESVKKHLGLTFHRFIEAGMVSISLVEEEVEPISPFNVSEEVPSKELAEEQLSINGQPILIQPFILPHESKIPQIERVKLDMVRGWTEHQGIYLYRNNRLIIDGTWLDLDFRKKESQRLCRIKIDIPNSIDHEWQIDVKKASAKVPDTIRKRIKIICFTAIEKAIKVYTHRGTYIRQKDDKNRLIYLWKVKQHQGKRYFEINKLHPIYQLINEYLQDDAYIFNDYMKTLGETLPIGFIVSTFSDPSMIMKDVFEGSKEDLNRIYQNTIAALISSGVSEKEAIEKVNNIDCFQTVKRNLK